VSRGSVPRLFACCGTLALLAIAATPGPAGSAQWTLRQLPPLRNSENHPIQFGISGISCPTESLCVAVGGRQGTFAFSQNPTGGVDSWHMTKLEYPVGPGRTCVAGEPDCEPPSGALQAVSCASEGLCALTTYDGWIFVSADPAGGTAAWSAVNVNVQGQKGATHLISISCPSPAFCAAVSGGSNNANAGRVLTSTNPIAGQWRSTQLSSSLDFRGISCGTPSLCVAVAKEGRLFVSTDPTGGAAAWVAAGTPGGPGNLEAVDCVSTLLCAAGNQTGNVLTSTNPAGGGSTWSENDVGGSVQITGISCPIASACVAVDNNGDVATSDDVTGGPGSWQFENLIPFHPSDPEEEPPVKGNALFAASCASASLCALAGTEGRVFTSTDPFSRSGPGPSHRGRRAPRRPRTTIVFAENFWKFSRTRRRHLRAHFRFFSRTRHRGFECKPDGRPYRRCRSPLRYWVEPGRHILRVRAIGPTGLRGPAASQRFRVYRPRTIAHLRGA
jgi:hypothetical protein